MGDISKRVEESGTASVPEAPEQESERPVIGKSSATERDPNSSESFSCWLAPNIIVNPFDILEADQMEGTSTYGLVTNIKQITDSPSHLSNFISSDFGETDGEAQTPRQGANVAEVNVLANHDPASPAKYPMGIYMPVQSDSKVRFADELGIHVSLGINRLMEEEKETGERLAIPAGLIEMSNGVKARVYLDKRFVLGPEGAHVNIAGISGLATKTSYAMFLVQSILQTVGEENVAVILLNVKQNDLLVIDQPGSVSPKDDKMWRDLGLEPKPFNKVKYFLPWGKDTQNTGLPNSFGDPPENHEVYAYSLLDVLGSSAAPGPGLGALVRVPDEHDTMGSLIGEIQQGIPNSEPQWKTVKTWDQLLNGDPLMKAGVPQKLGVIHPSSVGRFVRVLRRVVKNKNSGVFVQQRDRKTVNLGERLRSELKGGETYVVDIAQLRDEERALVFGHVIQEVYNLYAEAGSDKELPEKVLIFVDELNKYAPAKRGQSESSILEYVLDIAARGRSLGVVLISAEQFMSEVHGQVVGNCGTKVIGRSDSAELSDAAYRMIPQDIKMHLTRMDKGQLLLSHPLYRQPVRITFPRPAYKAIGHSRK